MACENDMTVGIYAERRQHLAVCLARLGTNTTFSTHEGLVRYTMRVWPDAAISGPVDLRDWLGLEQPTYEGVFTVEPLGASAVASRLFLL